MEATSFSSAIRETGFSRAYPRARARLVVPLSCNSFANESDRDKALSASASFCPSRSGPVQKRSPIGPALCVDATGAVTHSEGSNGVCRRAGAAEEKIGVLLLNLGSPEMLNDV